MRFISVLGLLVLVSGCSLRSRVASEFPSRDFASSDFASNIGAHIGASSRVAFDRAVALDDYDRPHAPSPNYRGDDAGVEADDEQPRAIDLWANH
jgi:hypothetical protein